MLNENLTLYDVLDIGPEATPQDIREAYVRTKAAYNRDSVVLYTLVSTEEREETLKRIEDAYSILSDPDKRRAYDQNHGLFRSYENPFAGVTQSEAREGLDSSVVSIDRVPPMESILDGENLLIPPKTDFSTMSGSSFPDSQSSEASAPRNAAIDEDAPMRPMPEPAVEPSHGTPPPFVPQRSSKPVAHPVRRQVGGLKRLVSPLASDILNEIANQTEWKGEFLKKVREASQISLEEMSGVTKITKTYLVALEEDQFTKLPAPVYVRGFVIQISKVLKLPHEKVASAYLARLTAANSAR